MITSRQQPILDDKQWAEVRALFDRCLELSAAEREAILANENEAVRGQVESLLAQVEPENETFHPTRFGKYWLLDRLGTGGMAEVFLAKQADRLVAFKRILPEFSRDPSFNTFFRNEAKLGSRLSHANIVHQYDFGQQDGVYYLVMELVNGVNLAHVLERGHALAPELCAHIACEVAEGLDYAHRRVDDATGEPLGIVHRDISPKNIMLSFDGDVKIVDFGVAKANDRGSMTRAGEVRGSAGYLSPEAISGKPFDGRSDLFSLAIVLYEMLSGRRLFEDENLFAIISKIRDGQVAEKSVSELVAPPALKEVLRRGLASHPEERYATALEFRKAIGATAAGREGVANLLSRLFPSEKSARREVISRALATVKSMEASTIPPRRARWPQIVLPALTAFSMLVGAVRFFSQGTPVDPAAGRARPVDSICATEIAEYCPGLQIRSGLFMCLRRHRDSLSERCGAFLDRVPIPNETAK